jgi:hypothetical protein
MIGASGLSDDDDGKNDGLKCKAAILKGGSVKVQKYTSVIQHTKMFASGMTMTLLVYLMTMPSYGRIHRHVAVLRGALNTFINTIH